MKNRDIDFLFEVGSLHNVPRAWKQVLGLQVGNIVEHILRVILIALVIARREGVKDEEKIMKMALFHDLAESRTLDSAFIHKEYMERHEEKAITDMLASTVFQPDLKILKEYEERETIESKIIRDADHLEVDFELMELEKTGSKTATKMKEGRKSVRDNKFHTKAAKELWDQLQSSNPDKWHLDLSDSWIKKLR